MQIYAFPKDYPSSDAFRVTAEGKPIGVYACRVSAVPFNQIWPGYQRPMDQTELSSFAMLASDAPVTLEIEADAPFEKLTVRPLRHQIVPQVSGKHITLTLPGAGQYTLEADSQHRMLALFVDPEAQHLPEKDAPGVLYFGAGVHDAGKIELQDGQTVFIDEGAVLYGALHAEGKKNITVCGRGILDNSRMARREGGPIAFSHCTDVRVDGITVVDSSVWSMHFAGCANVSVNNIKLIGMWRYNSDGCDFTNSVHCRLTNSFLRNYDDCIVIKGLKDNRELPLEDVVAEHCVLWCDWGKPLELGAETSAPYISHVTFRDCDVIHGSFVMMDFMHGDRAEISEVVFEDIRCEYPATDAAPSLQTAPGQVYVNANPGYMPQLIQVGTVRSIYSVDDTTGNIHRVQFKDIQIFSEDGRTPPSSIEVAAEGTEIADIRIENVTLNGEKLATPEKLRLKITGNVRNLSVN